MKDFRKARNIILYILAWVIVLGIATYVGLPSTYAKQYPLLTRVIHAEDYVACKDFNGHVWIFDDVEDWCVGDYCNLLMNDCGTPDIHDDVIVGTYYERSDF